MILLAIILLGQVLLSRKLYYFFEDIFLTEDFIRERFYEDNLAVLRKYIKDANSRQKSFLRPERSEGRPGGKRS